jgi:hypothetical protein
MLAPTGISEMLYNIFRTALYLQPWLVEHRDPAHTNPSAQLPAARRDDRLAAPWRTADRKHWFVDKVRPHNWYIVTPINTRNR